MKLFELTRHRSVFAQKFARREATSKDLQESSLVMAINCNADLQSGYWPVAIFDQSFALAELGFYSFPSNVVLTRTIAPGRPILLKVLRSESDVSIDELNHNFRMLRLKISEWHEQEYLYAMDDDLTHLDRVVLYDIRHHWSMKSEEQQIAANILNLLAVSK